MQWICITCDPLVLVQEILLIVSCPLGRLSPVSNLKLTTSNTTLSLTWEPPFTLDITSVDPDISGYYVEVVAVNLLTSSEIYSEYDINGTEFSYPIPQDAGCDIYFFTITAVNIVGMGEAATTPPYHRPLDTGILLSDCMML